MLLEGLGDDDPRTRVEGRRYSTEAALLWSAIGELKRMTVQTSLSLGNKKIDKEIDHPKYPWMESTKKNVRRYGDVGDLTNGQVLDILAGMSIQGRRRLNGG